MARYRESGDVYYLLVKVKNRAGSMSNVTISSPIIIVGDNVPGVISDGRKFDIDEKHTRDAASIALNFQGFESESCSIIGYELAIGSKPFHSDVSAFSDFGVVYNDTHGFGERHLHLNEGYTYFATVRARTGHICHDSFIVSSSNGITLDFTPPLLVYISIENEIFHQHYMTNFDISWIVTDKSDVVNVNYSVGYTPFTDDILPSTKTEDFRIPPTVVDPPQGESVFVTVFAKDTAGNEITDSFGHYTVDKSKPFAQGYACSRVISMKSSSINCSWTVFELESTVVFQSISVGSKALSDDVEHEKEISRTESSWKGSIKNLSGNPVFVTLKVKNILNLQQSFVFEVMVDMTPPMIESVEIVTWTHPNEDIERKLCQITWSYVDARLNGVKDRDSGILR